MLGSSGVANVYVESFFTKMVPSDIAGTMKGVFNFFGQFGVFTITLLSGYLNDHFGPSSPFYVVGTLDGILAIMTLTLCALDKIGQHKINN